MKAWNTRPIERKDNEAIAHIIRTVLTEFKANQPGTAFTDSATDNLFDLFSVPGSMYRIVEEDGWVVGGGGIYPTEGLPAGHCELVKLYLLPETRGKGIGRALIEECFTAASEFGNTHMYLESMSELGEAVTLYEKLGFHKVTSPLGCTGHFACDIWMLKELSNNSQL